MRSPSVNTIAATVVALICIGGLFGAAHSFRVVSGYMTAIRLATEAAEKYGDQEYDPPEIDRTRTGGYFIWFSPKSRSGQLNVTIEREDGQWKVTHVIRNCQRVPLSP